MRLSALGSEGCNCGLSPQSQSFRFFTGSPVSGSSLLLSHLYQPKAQGLHQGDLSLESLDLSFCLPSSADLLRILQSYQPLGCCFWYLDVVAPDVGVPTSLNFFVLLGLHLIFYYSLLVLEWSPPDFVFAQLF